VQELREKLAHKQFSLVVLLAMFHLQTLVEVAPLLGSALDDTSLSFFCDKAARVFMPRFHDAVGSVKRWARAN